MTTEIETTTDDQVSDLVPAVESDEPAEPSKADIKAAEKAEKLSDLKMNEAVINKGAKAVRTSLPLMAEALMAIRDGKLYKVATDPETGKGFKSFDKYLASKDEWGFSRQYASKLINERKDQIAIESGVEPETTAKREPKTFTDTEYAAKVARSFGTFGTTTAKYRDGASDKFAQDYDIAYRAAEKAFAVLAGKYPQPVEETETTDATE